jgi:hypothetical protein
VESGGYAELSFERADIGGIEAARWHFRLGELEKVDYFLNACGTGYAVLGATPVGSFDRFAGDFEHAIETLAAEC